MYLLKYFSCVAKIFSQRKQRLHPKLIFIKSQELCYVIILVVLYNEIFYFAILPPNQIMTCVRSTINQTEQWKLKMNCCFHQALHISLITQQKIIVAALSLKPFVVVIMQQHHIAIY